MLSMRLFRSLQHLQSSCRHLHSSCCHLQSLAVMSGGQGRFSGVFPSPEGVRCSTVTCQRLNSSSPQQAIPTDPQRAGGRQRLVILGTGWGSYSVLRCIDKKQYNVLVISPRNHFLFTPLLASTTVGTLEFRKSMMLGESGIKFCPTLNWPFSLALTKRRRSISCMLLLLEAVPQGWSLGRSCMILLNRMWLGFTNSSRRKCV